MRLRVLRTLEQYEYDILPIFLYNAIPQNDDEELLDITVIKETKYKKYIDKFGKDDDYALVWEMDGQIAGIAWIRFFEEADQSFGYLNDSTPELTVSILPGYNSLEIGTELIELMINELRIKNFSDLSVSISTSDELKDVYEKSGFEEKEEQADDRLLLVKHLNELENA